MKKIENKRNKRVLIDFNLKKSMNMFGEKMLNSKKLI